MTRIDAFAGTRNLVENAISHLTWHEKACLDADFKGISQIWKDEPAWYFWLSSVKGGFLLRLHATEPVGDSEYVSLSVHYYPPSEESGSWQLSAEELALLSDETFFDQPTNTPQFEQFEACLPYFLAAEIGLMIGPENQLQMIMFSSQENMQHPTAKLFDLLVSSLNFEARKHHCQARQLESAPDNSLFLVYEESAFRAFMHHFELEDLSFREPMLQELLIKWKNFAHMNVDCSVNGTCSCH